MAFGTQTKTSQSVISKRIGTTLQNNGCWLKKVHDALNDRLENLFVTLIIYSFLQWNIKWIISTAFSSNFIHVPCFKRIRFQNQVFNIYLQNLKKVTCSRKKVISIFVKGNCHNSISEIKCFLHTVAVMYIYVNVKNSRMISRRNQVFLRMCCKTKSNRYKLTDLQFFFFKNKYAL